MPSPPTGLTIVIGVPVVVLLYAWFNGGLDMATRRKRSKRKKTCTAAQERQGKCKRSTTRRRRRGGNY